MIKLGLILFRSGCLLDKVWRHSAQIDQRSYKGGMTREWDVDVFQKQLSISFRKTISRVASTPWFLTEGCTFIDMPNNFIHSLISVWKTEDDTLEIVIQTQDKSKKLYGVPIMSIWSYQRIPIAAAAYYDMATSLYYCVVTARCFYLFDDI